MQFLYNILIFKAIVFFKIAAVFHKKINLFVKGRAQTNLKLKEAIAKNDQVIWMHCASLGEFEQGRPILEKLKKQYPNHKLVLSFFSPSGYQVRKNYQEVDVVCYLPLDSKRRVKIFLDLLHPEIAIFVKYEFWPNLLNELKNRQVKTLLVSGIFRENQIFFKWYGSFMRTSLQAISHFFVQDTASKKLLNNKKFTNVTVSGDTRFDRVFEITQQNNNLQFMSDFKNGQHVLVAGSTWKEDEDLLVNYINHQASKNEKFVIAPHNINAKAILKLKTAIAKKTVLFSEKEKQNIAHFQVLIIDTVGLLTKIYSYANTAYVGGGYTKSGVHNVLEPATFGMPILIGPNYSKFKEAVDLVKSKACFVVNTSEKLTLYLKRFLQNKKQAQVAGNIASNYIAEQTGATLKVLNYLKK